MVTYIFYFIISMRTASSITEKKLTTFSVDEIYSTEGDLTGLSLVHKGWKISFYAHFAPAQPCAMLTKHFDLTQVCILLFFNIERGNGGAGTYSVGNTVRSSCFCHFPTQFVHDCIFFIS